MNPKEKEAAYAEIESGRADLIVGTHAMIQERVVYKDLALVVTDEQHRFGVVHRDAIAQKGNNPHVMVMKCDANSAHACTDFIRRPRYLNH